MAKGSGKGAAFERDVCKMLSLWWTYGKRDDVFWRTQISGGRATSRSKKGEYTYGQYGDVQAVNPMGEALVRLCTIELKRGYSSDVFCNVLDAPCGSAVQAWEKWICQATTQAKEAGTPAWLLITKRDRREILLTMPTRLYRWLHMAGVQWNRVEKMSRYSSWGVSALVIMKLADWTQVVHPEYIEYVYEEFGDDERHPGQD